MPEIAPEIPLVIQLPSGQPAYYNPYSGTYGRNKQYAQRLQRAYRAGQTRQTGRGHTAGHLTEYERVKATAAAHNQTPYQRFTRSFERRWGFKYSYWLYLRRHWVDEINGMSSPNSPGKITPAMVSMELQNSGVFTLPGGFPLPSPTLLMRGPEGPVVSQGEAWIELRLEERLEDMNEYREGNKEPGHFHWMTRNAYRPVEWWYYH